MAVRRGAKVYFIANLVAMLCAAIRYTVYARVLGPEQLGLAATIILTAAFFDTVTDTGSDRFLIQDRDGGEADALAMVHAVLVLRGIFIAGTMILASALLAAFFKSPSLQLGFVLLAATPFITGFQNADMRRQQRDHDFRPEAVCILACELASVGVAVWLALVLHNYYCAVLATIARAVVLVVSTHLSASVRYSIRFSRRYAGKLSRFGGPLILNGIGVYFGGQGDRLVIANRLTVTELGLYSAVSLLGYYPMALAGKFLMAIQMPMVAGSRESQAARETVLDAVAGDTTLLSIALVTGFTLVTPFALTPLYGSRFAQSTVVIALVGFLQACRLLRNWPITVALGIGRSLPVMVSNFVRLVAFPASITAVTLGYGTIGLLSGFIFGEIVAAATNLVMVNVAVRRNPLADLDRLFLLSVCGGATAAIAHDAPHSLHFVGASITVLVALVISTAILFREQHTLTRWISLIWRLASGIRRRLPLPTA